MAKVFRQLSDFWNSIMDEMQNLISAFDANGGETFSKLKDMIASLLGDAADKAETLGTDKE